MKKIFKKILIVLLIPVAIFFIMAVLLYIPSVQNWIVRQVTSTASEKTGLDISTISRVSNVKYVQTNWGTFPLRFFFTDGYTTDNGEEMSTRKIKMALKDIIAKEDKKKPKSDDVITREMAALGYPIARRTVAKYREQMGIPVARLRK